MRDWCTLMPAGATLKNCYRARKGDMDGEETFAVPQSFSFMAREGPFPSCSVTQRVLELAGVVSKIHVFFPSCIPEGMPGNGVGLDLDDKVPRRLRMEGNAKDVFAMVKGAMSDGHLIQAPILVYPQAFLPATESFFRKINSCTSFLTASLDEARCQELTEMARFIEMDFPHLQRGVAYLRSLVDSDRPRQPSPTLKFIEAGPKASLGFNNLQLGPQAAPPRPHRLQVVFHHQPARGWCFWVLSSVCEDWRMTCGTCLGGGCKRSEQSMKQSLSTISGPPTRLAGDRVFDGVRSKKHWFTCAFSAPSHNPMFVTYMMESVDRKLACHPQGFWIQNLQWQCPASPNGGASCRCPQRWNPQQDPRFLWVSWGLKCK